MCDCPGVFSVNLQKFCITFDWNEISKNPETVFSASDGDFMQRNRSTKYKKSLGALSF